ncbi:hypothetical protein D3C72_1910590 [compost metagenome]
MADGTDRAAFVQRAMGLGAIFNDLEVILRSQRHDRIHVARPAGQVHADHRPGAFTQHRANSLSANVLGVDIDIGKYRHCPRIDYRGNRGKEGTRSDDDLIAGSNTQCLEC